MSIQQSYSDHKVIVEEAMDRNLISKIGKYTFYGASSIATVAGIIAAPRTTLGLAAIGAGLVCAGNAEQLKNWGSSFGKNDDTPAVKAEAVVVDAPVAA